MLVLSRKKGERVVIGGIIVLHILQITPTKVRVGIDAPSNVSVARHELLGDPPWCQPDEVRQRLCQGVYLDQAISEEQISLCKICSCCQPEMLVEIR